MGRYRAMVFDIDSTICDNTDRKKLAIEMAIGASIDDGIYGQIRYRSFPEILRRLGYNPDRDLVMKVEDRFLEDEDLYELDRPAEGALETLRRLSQRYKLCYVTGRPKEHLAASFLKKYGFPMGPVVADKIRTGEGMKKTVMFQRALSSLGVRPSEAVSVGDMPEDGMASRTIGMLSVGVSKLSTIDFDEMLKYFDHVIHRIDGLIELMEKIDR